MKKQAVLRRHEADYKVQPLYTPFNVTLTMPGSKSHANRAIIAACLTNGTTIITNATPCDDVTLMVQNVQKMGFDVQWVERNKGELEIHGGLPLRRRAVLPAEKIELHCGNAGTTLRFLTSLAAVTPGEWILTGDTQMQKRPIGDLVRALRSLGADIQCQSDCPPIRVHGGTLKGGRANIDASKSSQFLSSLLLVGPVVERGLHIELSGDLASAGYVDITKNLIKDFGVSIVSIKNTFIVQNCEYRSPGTYSIEGDWSAAGAWLVLAELAKSSVHFTNLSKNSPQSDKLITKYIQNIALKGDITIDCREIPDQVMNLAVLATFRSGKTMITGVENLRFKECDRLEVITSALKKAGAKIELLNNQLCIEGLSAGSALRQSSNGIQLNPHNDHRMAMAFAVLGCLKQGIHISNSQCVSKSYPQFFEDLKKVQQSQRPIAIVGMRGIGKTNIARRISSQSCMKPVDTDTIFERIYGKVSDFVLKKGWNEFRKIEEKIVQESLQPCRIVSLGGGAIESAATREIIRQKAIVLWMQASAALTVQRLKASKRPRLTKMPLEEEVAELCRKRDPMYRSVAHIVLPQNIPFSRQVPYVLGKLRGLFSR